MMHYDERLPIIDWQYADEEIADPQLHAELVRLSHDEIGRHVAQLQQMTTGNYVGAWPAYKSARGVGDGAGRCSGACEGAPPTPLNPSRRFIHSIKNDAVSCGFSRFADACQRYESMGPSAFPRRFCRLLSTGKAPSSLRRHHE